ncbi:MAG TPA: DUF362 domain-containing protein [Candidatus Binatia bacterium]|nr:DUF362 domain-containing protein [Candidatus Binatia bacterium]
MTRRQALRLLAGSAAATAATAFLRCGFGTHGRRARVHLLRVPSYAALVAADIAAAVPREHLRRIRGRRVLLKPNLIEYRPNQPIHTDPRLVGTTIEAFAQLGAADVVVAEGPGHRRDTDYLLAASGLRDVVGCAGVRFVDLNLDVTRPEPIPGRSLTGLERLHLPRTVTEADYVVSMPKMKTHHLVGVTLSLKNLFGVLPSALYGWPKNFFHWKGIGPSILDVNRTVPVDLAIVDGVVGMDGDGPLWGNPVASGVVVVGADLASVDATCCRLMGLRPERVEYLVAAADVHGSIAAADVEIAGARLAGLVRPYRPPATFPRLQAPGIDAGTRGTG